MTDNDGMAWSPRDTILPPEWTVIHEVFAAAKTARESMATFVPLLTWMSREGIGGMTAIAHEPGGLSDAVDAALEMVEEHYPHPAWFAVVVDAYGRVTDPNDTDIVAEELSDRFIMGDESVVEQLMLFVVFEGRPVHVWRRVYRNTIVDGWEWESAEMMLNPVLPVGNLLQVLQRHTPATGD